MSDSLLDKVNELAIQESEAPLTSEPAEDDFAAQFADMKKKKKKKAPMASSSGGREEEGSGTLVGETGPSASTFSTGGGGGGESNSGYDRNQASGLESEAGVGMEGESGCSVRDGQYAELLSRIFHILRQNNPDLAGERKKYSMVPPSIHREGNKKTLFANLTEICKRMNRSPEHVIQYLFTELGTTGSTDGSERLIIKGRFQQKQIENVLKRYIVEYVTCKTCKSPNTVLRRENRLFFQQCGSCGSTRSVSAIKSGFKAQTEKRAALRNKEA